MVESSYYYTLFENLEDRLDENYNNPRFEEIKDLLKKSKFDRIIDIGNQCCLNYIVSGKTPKGLKYVEEGTEGILFLGASNIFPGKIELETAPRIPPEVHNTELKSSKIIKNNVLISIAGTYIGICAVYDDAKECNANQAVAILDMNKDEIVPNYFVKYLNSHIGQLFFDKSQHFSSQSNINLSEIKKIKLVLPTKIVQENILEEIKPIESEAVNLEQESHEIRRSAGFQLLNKLGIELKEEMVIDYYSISFHEIANQLSYGKNHPSQRQLYDTFKNAKYKCKNLKDLIDLKSDSIEPSKNPDEDFLYIGLENIESDTGRLKNIQHIKGKDISSKSNVFKKGQLIFSGLRPYLNKCFVLEGQDAIGSAEFFVCEAKGNNSLEFLKFYLLSEATLRQTKWILSGSSYPRLDENDFLNLKIIIPEDLNVQIEIANLIKCQIKEAETKEEMAKKKWQEAKNKFERCIINE